MLLEYRVSKELWCSVNNLIIELGMENYHLSNGRIIVGDLENALAINSIILKIKKVIYNSMEKEQEHSIPNLNDIQNLYFQERYRHHIKMRGKPIEKQYLLLSYIYAKKWLVITQYYICKHLDHRSDMIILLVPCILEDEIQKGLKNKNNLT